jgi:hypothetical protein
MQTYLSHAPPSSSYFDSKVRVTKCRHAFDNCFPLDFFAPWKLIGNLHYSPILGLEVYMKPVVGKVSEGVTARAGTG